MGVISRILRGMGWLFFGAMCLFGTWGAWSYLSFRAENKQRVAEFNKTR